MATCVPVAVWEWRSQPLANQRCDGNGGVATITEHRDLHVTRAAGGDELDDAEAAHEPCTVADLGHRLGVAEFRRLVEHVVR